jgi:hypothetical protein
MKRYAFVFTLVVLVAPMLLGLRPGPAAHAAPSFKNASVNILHQADLTTGGVNVTVFYSCTPSGSTTMGDLLVQVRQFPNNDTNVIPATGDGKTHQATVSVAGTFSPGAAAFRGGFAATQSLPQCDGGTPQPARFLFPTAQ